MWRALADIWDIIGDQDLYQVLSVSCDADMSTIKRAYRSLAWACHPDRHPEDPACEERFKLATAAYEVLSSTRLRAQYDARRHPRLSREDGWTVKKRHARTDPAWWYSTSPYDFSIAPSIGPYMGLSFDHLRQFKTKPPRRFRIIVYGAYDIYGAISPEDNGVAILDEDHRRVLTDRIAQHATGWFGPAPEQLAIAKDLTTMSAAKFRSFVNRHPRSRYTLDVKLNLEAERYE